MKTKTQSEKTDNTKLNARTSIFLRMEVEREKKMKKELSGKVFDRIKYNNNIYAVGDIIEVIVSPSYEISIAKIVKIIHSNNNLKYKYWPMIEVDWLYQKKDLENLGMTDISWIGFLEVFQSNHKDYIFIESIVKKIQLLTLEDYQNLEIVNEGIYYTRGKIDVTKVSSL